MPTKPWERWINVKGYIAETSKTQMVTAEEYCQKDQIRLL